MPEIELSANDILKGPFHITTEDLRFIKGGFDDPYDMLVIRDSTGIVAKFEELRLNHSHIEFLEILLETYEACYIDRHVDRE